jgi:hypothetical protein
LDLAPALGFAALDERQDLLHPRRVAGVAKFLLAAAGGRFLAGVAVTGVTVTVTVTVTGFSTSAGLGASIIATTGWYERE